MVSLQENTRPNGQLVLGTPEVMGNPQDLPQVVGLSPEDYTVQRIVDWVVLYSSSNCIQFVVRQLDMLNVLMNDYGKEFFMEGESAEAVS